MACSEAGVQDDADRSGEWVGDQTVDLAAPIVERCVDSCADLELEEDILCVWRNETEGLAASNEWRLVAEVWREGLSLIPYEAQYASLVGAFATEAAVAFEHCEEFDRAAVLWDRAYEHDRAAMAYEKVTDYRRAAVRWEWAGDIDRALLARERAGDFDGAIELLGHEDDPPDDDPLFAALEEARSYADCGSFGIAARLLEGVAGAERFAIEAWVCAGELDEALRLTRYHAEQASATGGTKAEVEWWDLIRSLSAVQPVDEAWLDVLDKQFATLLEERELWGRAAVIWHLAGALDRSALAHEMAGDLRHAAARWEEHGDLERAAALWDHLGETARSQAALSMKDVEDALPFDGDL